MDPFKILHGSIQFCRTQFKVPCNRRSCQHYHHFQDIKAKVRSGRARGEQQECGCDIETLYIKEEADNEVAAAEPGAHIEDTREFRSVILSFVRNMFTALQILLQGMDVHLII
jgi:hypothetical protein